MSFHDILFPAAFEPFLVAKSTFNTSKIICSSGREIRSSNHSYAITQYQLKDFCISEADFTVFNNFFKARRGSRFTFKLRDFADYSVEKQIIAIGDGEKKVFQLQKAYEDEKHPYIRKITKIRKDSLKVFIDDNKTDQWKINENTGLLEMDNVLNNEANLIANFDFYAVVRFAEDSFDYERKADGTIEILNVSLIEVLE